VPGCPSQRLQLGSVPEEGAVVLAQVVADEDNDGMLETLEAETDEAETSDALEVVEELVLEHLPNNGWQPASQ
jgi:hypothetical protein